MGDEGNVTTYKFKNDYWYSYDDVLSKESLIVKNIINGNIYDGFVTTQQSKTVLVVVGSNGEVASGFSKENAWTKPNGIRKSSLRQGPNIFHDGSSRDYKDIYNVLSYLNYFILFGKEGLITIFDKDKYTFNTVGDFRNISNDGHHNGYKNVFATLNYDFSILITGGEEGRITSYYGENEHWREFDENVGICDIGQLLEYNTIYTIEYTFGITNYIIFAGGKGRVGTYNVDVHEVPFRFDPYKTAFLLWYKTPGNAYIISNWTLPHNVINLFSMYKAADDTNYDIEIADGDIDIVADIDLDDRGHYPKPYAERTKYMADFINNLPEDRYTIDEIWDKYMDSKHKHILYPCDVIPLCGGDPVDIEDDIDLTNDLEGDI
jgi:hypothetical protein